MTWITEKNTSITSKTTAKKKNKNKIGKSGIAIAAITLLLSSSIVANSSAFSSEESKCVDLSTIDFSEIDYSKIDWSSIDMTTEEDFSCTDWSKVDLSQIKWSQIPWLEIKGFEELSELDESDWDSINWDEVDLQEEIVEASLDKNGLGMLDPLQFVIFAYADEGSKISKAWKALKKIGKKLGWAYTLADAAYEIWKAFKDSDDDDDKGKKEYESKAGDPMFIEDPLYPITSNRLDWTSYRDWDTPYSPHQEKLFYFDFDCNGQNEMGDRNPRGTLVVFIDINENNRVDNGCELLWSLTESAYVNALSFDTNHNGYLEPWDSTWHLVKITDFNDHVWHAEELGYQQFDLIQNKMYDSDCFGVGIYSDGEKGYVHDEAYKQCIDEGFEPVWLTDQHFRMMGYSQCGAFHEEFGCVRTF